LKKSSALINTFYSTISTYVEFFFGLLISILIARQLGPEQFGIYSYLIWLSALSMVVINGGVSLGCIKFIAEARANESSNVILSIYRYFQLVQLKKLIIYALITFGVIYFFGDNLTQNLNPHIFYVVVVASMIKTYYMYGVSVLKGFEDFRALAAVSLVISPINFILILTCYITEQPLQIYIWVYFIVSTLYLISLYPLLFKRINDFRIHSHSINLTLKHRMSHHLWTASWISIFNFIVLRQSELFFLNIFSTPEDMAYFNVGYSLAFASMALVPGVYSTILLPLMAGENSKGGGNVEYQLKVSLRYMFQLIIALIMPVCFFAKQIFIFLYGAQYLSAVVPFQIILVCISLKTLSDCTNAYFLSIDGQSFVLKLIIAASILTLSLDFFLIKQYQLMGALIAISASTIFMTFSYMFFTLKRLNIKLEWNIYARTLLCGAIAMLLISPIGHYAPNIYGVIIGGGGYVILYIFMLLFTYSMSYEDITTVRNANKKYIKVKIFDKLLLRLQEKTSSKGMI